MPLSPPFSLPLCTVLVIICKHARRNSQKYLICMLQIVFVTFLFYDFSLLSSSFACKQRIILVSKTATIQSENLRRPLNNTVCRRSHFFISLNKSRPNYASRIATIGIFRGSLLLRHAQINEMPRKSLIDDAKTREFSRVIAIFEAKPPIHLGFASLKSDFSNFPLIKNLRGPPLRRQISEHFVRFRSHSGFHLISFCIFILFNV